MQLQRNHGFQQNQCYGMETQQESYEVHEETWSPRNGHHNHFPGKRMTNGMFREGHHGSSGHFSGGGHSHSFGGAPPLFSNGSHHQGHGRDYFSEVNKYEMHNSAGNMKVDEMRNERHNWGGGNGFCANPCDRNMNNRSHKVEWDVKGV
ncbi:hypothetical protein K1719_015024 [Acacia pycnantha]|nr:hypothetical protein K1719_015024 [Acacia pycnantha]